MCPMPRVALQLGSICLSLGSSLHYKTKQNSKVPATTPLSQKLGAQLPLQVHGSSRRAGSLQHLSKQSHQEALWPCGNFTLACLRKTLNSEVHGAGAFTCNVPFTSLCHSTLQEAGSPGGMEQHWPREGPWGWTRASGKADRNIPCMEDCWKDVCL